VRGRGRSSGVWKRVDAARALAADALGREKPPPSKPLPKPTKPEPLGIIWVKPSPDATRVLTIGEAAQRLGIRRQELEEPIARGDVATLAAIVPNLRAIANQFWEQRADC
jgi:hypothetical protein